MKVYKPSKIRLLIDKLRLYNVDYNYNASGEPYYTNIPSKFGIFLIKIGVRKNPVDDTYWWKR